LAGLAATSSPSANFTPFIVSVGGVLGMGEKHVAMPFNVVHTTQKNGKWWLTMNATKDGLKSAPGYKYDRTKATWEPA
jgi:hypothetical protein